MRFLKLNMLFLGLIFLSTASGMLKKESFQQNRFCHIYGSIAVVDDPRRAQYKVYIEESEGLADIVVFEEEIRLYADRQGIWHFMKNPGLADYVVYFEENKFFSDFSITYTDIESFARCQ